MKKSYPEEEITANSFKSKQSMSKRTNREIERRRKYLEFSFPLAVI
jgi:hypothetical protein